MAKTLTRLSKVVNDLDGAPITNGVTPITPKSIIANALARGQSDEPARAMAIALMFHNANDELELEDADFLLASGAVKDDRLLNNMAKAAALEVFVAIS